jgi:hypothetical protein
VTPKNDGSKQDSGAKTTNNINAEIFQLEECRATDSHNEEDEQAKERSAYGERRDRTDIVMSTNQPRRHPQHQFSAIGNRQCKDGPEENSRN